MNTEDNERFSEWYKALHIDIKEDVCAFSAKCGFNAAEAPLLARIAELEGQLANREPFVVRLPCVIKAAEKYAENYDDDDRECIKTDVINAFYAGTKFCKAAITAAGGRCE